MLSATFDVTRFIAKKNYEVFFSILPQKGRICAESSSFLEVQTFSCLYWRHAEIGWIGLKRVIKPSNFFHSTFWIITYFQDFMVTFLSMERILKFKSKLLIMKNSYTLTEIKAFSRKIRPKILWIRKQQYCH